MRIYPSAVTNSEMHIFALFALLRIAICVYCFCSEAQKSSKIYYLREM